jgi:omega-6 fatty acid desaturase (delta-12 desaturase)
VGSLENRGIGDVYTMTVNEYKEKTRWGKLKYRMYRNPFFLFVFIPSIVFVLWYRFPTSRNKALKKVESSVYFTDIALVLVCGGIMLLVGIKTFLLVQMPILIISTAVGQWLFYVQHQFEKTYWASKSEWDYVSAALHGSSFYKLPVVLQWFTGNIGFHHIHHLNPGIPNYMLEKCHKDNPVFQNVIQIKIKNLKSMFLTLWDEKQKKLISFHQFKTHAQ